MSKEVRLNVARRRARVAELLCANPRITTGEIAEMLGCNPQTIGLDIRAIRREWANRRLLLYESHVAEDIARTDEALKAIWPMVLAGKGWAIDRLISLLNYRLKALGLETQRYELDIGAVLANYLARASKEVQSGPTPDAVQSGPALDEPAIEVEYKIAQGTPALGIEGTTHITKEEE